MPEFEEQEEQEEIGAMPLPIVPTARSSVLPPPELEPERESEFQMVGEDKPVSGDEDPREDISELTKLNKAQKNWQFGMSGVMGEMDDLVDDDFSDVVDLDEEDRRDLFEVDSADILGRPRIRKDARKVRLADRGRRFIHPPRPISMGGTQI
tara:strand:- start:323 stop:778 length:456 start_codon:yes stop_codon:yes gene_type:complete